MGLFRAQTPTLHHADHTVTLRTKAGTATTLADFAAPLIPPFEGNPLLFNGHLQTVWTAAQSSDPFTVHYARHHLVNPLDGGHFAVDFVVPPFTAAEEEQGEQREPGERGQQGEEQQGEERGQEQEQGGEHGQEQREKEEDLPPRTRHMTLAEEEALGGDDDRPMLIALHGLSGGSHEVYLRAVLHALVQTDASPGPSPRPGAGGWAACVVNARGCAQSRITTPQLFNARWTSDLGAVVRKLSQRFPRRRLFAIGFSIGGNILTNYLGEEGAQSGLTAAVVCSNPWNLEVAHKALIRSWAGREVYSAAMGANLRRLFERHAPTLTANARIDAARVRRGRLLHDFDRDLTAVVFGYATVGAYYRDASCVDRLLGVRVPTLALHSEDDPIAMSEALPLDEVLANPHIVLATTPGGGHLGWFEWGGGRWFAKPVSLPHPETPGDGGLGRGRRRANRADRYATS